LLQGLLDRDWIRRWESILKSLVELLFLVLALTGITIIFMRLALRIDYHIGVHFAPAILLPPE